jgi:two-component system sensor kinase FixL
MGFFAQPAILIAALWGDSREPTRGLVWLHNISDLLIWFSFLIIPAVLFYFVRRRDLRFAWIYWMFGIFLLACGATYLMEVLTRYVPLYWLSSVIKVLTAIASLATAAALVMIIPKFLRSPGIKELEREISELTQAETALRQSEERFRRLVEGTQDYAIFMLDPQGKVTSWNPGAERIKGYQAEEIIGRHFSQFFTPEDIERGKPESELAKAVAEGRAEGEGWRVRKDGSRFWANGVVTALRNKEGRIQGFSKITRDLTEQRKAEETIRLYQDLVSNAPIGLVIYCLEKSNDHEELRLVSANPAASQLWGIQLDEHIGQTMVELQPAIEKTYVQRFIGVIRSGRLDDLGEVPYGDERTPTRLWSTKAFPLPDNCVGIAFEDVTERRRAERSLRESEERFRAWTASAKDAFVSADSLGQIVFWSKGAQGIFGYTADEAVGRPLTLLMPESYHQEHRRGLERYLSTGVTRVVGKTVELEGRTKTGREFPLELSLASWQTDKGVYFGGIIRDIGERKRAEEKLARFAQQVQRSNKELEQFASIASHDLQEPLRKIQAFGDRLETKCGDALSEQGRDYLRRMRSAAARMQIFINNLLTFSRLTTAGRPFVSVDLAEVAQDVLSDLESRLQESGGRVEVGSLPTIEADPMQMRQLFQNLIGNGLKFHQPGTPPNVRVEASVRRNGPDSWCQITFQDHGIGFENVYLPRIFEAFQRLHGPGEFEGTGMGLTICRRIVERHGGSITARGVPGQGATFIVILPVRQSQEERKHEPTTKAHNDSDG